MKYKLPSSLETTASLELENFSKELAKDRLAVTLKKAPNHWVFTWFHLGICTLSQDKKIGLVVTKLLITIVFLMANHVVINNETKLKLLGLTDRKLFLQVSDLRVCD